MKIGFLMLNNQLVNYIYYNGLIICYCISIFFCIISAIRCLDQLLNLMQRIIGNATIISTLSGVQCLLLQCNSIKIMEMMEVIRKTKDNIHFTLQGQIVVRSEQIEIHVVLTYFMKILVFFACVRCLVLYIFKGNT